MGVALHDELADLRAQVGPQIFDDPVAFRAAFDDYVSEGSASTGEVSLLVGAIATGALQRLKDQLALGADPATSIAAQADLLARDRGTSEPDGARWALSVLAQASGAIPADLMLTRPAVPDSLSKPDPPTDSRSDVVDPGPTVDRAGQPPTAFGDATQVASGEPSPDPHRPTAAAPEPGRPGGRRTNPLLLGAVVVLAVVAIVAVALLFLLDDDSPVDTASDDPTSDTDTGGPTDHATEPDDPTRDTDTGGPTDPAEEEELARADVREGGLSGRVLLVRNGAAGAVVLQVEADGEYVEVDRLPTTCPYGDESYDADVQVSHGTQILFGWQDRGGEAYGEYGEVLLDDELIVLHSAGAHPCPGEG